MEQYMTIPEAAVRWNMLPQLVRRECEMHQIEGAIRVRRSWLIPAETRRPTALETLGLWVQ